MLWDEAFSRYFNSFITHKFMNMHSDQPGQVSRPASLCPAPGARMEMLKTLYSKAPVEYGYSCPNLTFVLSWNQIIRKEHGFLLASNMCHG